MTASSEIRARRRFQELIEQDQNVTYDDVLNNVLERDYIDSNRNDSPLIQAKDAVIFDNSTLTLEQQYKKIMDLVKAKLGSQNAGDKID